MSRIKLPWVALGLCLLFAVFSLGYYFGSRPPGGTYVIRAENAPPDGGDYAAGMDAPSPAPSPAPASSGIPSSAAPSGTARDARININTAAAEELTDLPGIGPALAQRIVDYREENGPFETPEDIMDVSGIGEKTYEKFKDYITV